LLSEIPVAFQIEVKKRINFLVNKVQSILSADEWQTELLSAVRKNLKKDEMKKILYEVSK
jgi:hypothetical protein